MSRCDLCPAVNTCVPPSGPTETDIIFCGEAPGKDENKKGIPFIGHTGREVNEHYLPLANRRRENSYFTNAIRCLPIAPGGRLNQQSNKDLALLESCANHNLYNEIEAIQPQLIVPMGAFACRAIDPRIDLDMHHGMPFESERFGTCFPMWHPAGGVHEPKKMIQIRTDWIRLRRYLAGRLVIPQDEYPNPDYAEATMEDIEAIDPTFPMASDTEHSRSLGPYCLTYSQIPGTGRLIKAGRTDLLIAFQKKIEAWENVIIFHNWMYDVKIVTEMGLWFPDHVIRDSMIRSFHLGNLPQGLKVLAFRLLGMQMQDFEDLVKPYSSVEVLKYYREAFSIEWPKPEVQQRRQDDGTFKDYKPQSMTTKLKRFFSDYMKSPETKDVFEAWDNWEASHDMIEDTIGNWPGMDIAHVPYELVEYYACRDSDATIRIWPILEERKKKAMAGIPQENWEI